MLKIYINYSSFLIWMFCIKMTVASLVNNWQAQNQYWLSNMIFYSATQHQFLKLFIKILKWVYEKILNKSVIIFNSKVLPWSVLFWQLSTSILEAYLCIMARVLLFKTHITTAVESACRVVSSHLMISQDFLLENIPMYSFFWEGWLSQLKIKWLGPFSTDDQ